MTTTVQTDANNHHYQHNPTVNLFQLVVLRDMKMNGGKIM